METNITKINVGGTLLPVNDPNVCDNFEDGNTASKTYNAGEFLIWKGSLYKVTTTIAQGATFTDGVNLEDATITELLEAVNTALSHRVLSEYTTIATDTFGSAFTSAYSVFNTLSADDKSKANLEVWSNGSLIQRYTNDGDAYFSYIVAFTDLEVYTVRFTNKPYYFAYSSTAGTSTNKTNDTWGAGLTVKLTIN